MVRYQGGRIDEGVDAFFAGAAVVGARADAEAIVPGAEAAVVGFLLLAPGGPVLVGAFEQVLVFGCAGFS